jgi:LemA protein
VALWIIIAVVVVLALGLIVSYNRFVKQRTQIRDAWANIDTEIKRRGDLIPNLVETVKGYASHEKGVFEEVARARSMAASASGPAEQAVADNMLTAAMRQLFAVAEAYPDLKANENFIHLQAQLTETEDRLSTARRFYNANVRDFNQRVMQFPSMIIARMFGFKEEPFFEVDEEVREGAPPPVSFDQGAVTAPAAPSADGGTPPPTAPPGETPPTPPASPAPPPPPAQG